MRFFEDKDGTYIVLEGSEEERAILRAIVKASFDLAHPVGLSVVDYHPECSLSDAEADQLIRSAPRSHDRRVIDMDFVQGRQCKTVLSKEAPGHFRLDTNFFERYRGSCVSVLERARELISQNGAVRSEHQLAASAQVKALAAAI